MESVAIACASEFSVFENCAMIFLRNGRMMEKLRKIVQPKLMAVSLLLSVFMGDYIFCHIVGEWIELGIIFLLLAHSSVIVKDCSPSAYLNAIFTNCLTIALYLMARHFLKDSFFKDMLIFFFLCSLPFFIATKIFRKIKNVRRKRERRFSKGK